MSLLMTAKKSMSHRVSIYNILGIGMDGRKKRSDRSLKFRK
jgi:hypothetical protein